MAVVTTWTELQALPTSVSSTLANALLTSDADYATVAGPSANGGLGFDPIVTFTGSFDGQEFQIDGLNINRPAVTNVGLFKNTSSGSISNVRLTNAVITGNSYTGIMIGDNLSTPVTNCLVDGSVNGGTRTAGMIGNSAGVTSVITECGADIIVNSTSTEAAALVAANDFGGDIIRSFGLGSVTNNSNNVGAIAGRSRSMDIIDCYGQVAFDGVVSSSNFGGIGGFYRDVNASNCYSASTFVNTNVPLTGGLFGAASGTANAVNSFWDTDITTIATTAGGGTGKTTAEMQTESTFTGAGWDFTTVWVMDAYPELQWNFTPIPTPSNGKTIVKPVVSNIITSVIN